MKLVYSTDRKRYEAICSYENRFIPKGAQFRFDGQTKTWWTDRDENAARLIEYADDTLKERLGSLATQQQTALQASRATDAEIELPCPEGLAYMPFQRGGIAYAMLRESVLIADEPGLGKTIQTAGIINADPSIKTALIVVPASLKINWKRELEKWLTRPFDIQIANGDCKGSIIIVNYDQLKKFKSVLMERTFDLFVSDEAHYLKNPKAQRTQLVFGTPKTKKAEAVPGIGQKARRRVLLTGTPIVNRPIELYPLISYLDPVRWANFFRYAMRYCGAHQGRFGWDFSGATNLEELQRILRETIMVRRLKKDVLLDLPSKVRQVIELQPEAGDQAFIEREMEDEERYESDIEELENARDFAEANNDTPAYEDAVAKLRDKQRVHFEEMSKRRHDTGVQKAPRVVEHVKELLEGGVSKVVVFAWHHDVVKILMDGLAEYGCVRLTGEDSMTTKQQSVDQFQTGSARVFVGSITAAGVGLTLTAASTVVFSELDWVPGNLSQAEDRCHRIGQKDSVLVQHVVLDGSLDAKMAKRLVAKQNVIDRALDKIAEKVAPVEPKAEKKERGPLADEPDMTPAEISAVHRMLQILAGMDTDHAREVNAMGFNKIDGRFGHSLAEANSLTQKQAKFGKRIVRKYKRQIAADLYSEVFV